MFFTQDDYKKIEEWLKKRAIKDIDLPEVNILNLNDKIPIIQDNQNKIISATNMMMESDAMNRAIEKMVKFFNTSLEQKLQKQIDTTNGTLFNIISDIGKNNGLVPLDNSGKISSVYLPSYVDDVIEVSTYSALPITGESGKIYLTIEENKIYRWGGTSYVEIPISLALGETSSTAFAGSRGVILENTVEELSSQLPVSNVTSTSPGLMSSEIFNLFSDIYDKIAGIAAIHKVYIGNKTDSGTSYKDVTPSNFRAFVDNNTPPKNLYIGFPKSFEVSTATEYGTALYANIEFNLEQPINLLKDNIPILYTGNLEAGSDKLAHNLQIASEFKSKGKPKGFAILSIGDDDEGSNTDTIFVWVKNYTANNVIFRSHGIREFSILKNYVLNLNTGLVIYQGEVVNDTSEQQETIKNIEAPISGGLKITTTNDSVTSVPYNELLPALMASRSTNSTLLPSNQEVFNTIKSGSQVNLVFAGGTIIIGTALQKPNGSWCIIEETIDDSLYVKNMYPVENTMEAVNMSISNKIELARKQFQ